MLLFAATGITLNHAAVVEPQPATTRLTLTLPPTQSARLSAGPADGPAPLPGPVVATLRERLGLDASGLAAEWSTAEVTLIAPRPGGDRSLTIDRASGVVTYETSSRGIVGMLNDLHTGRNSGPEWGWFIDLLAAGCLVFATTGLILLCLYAPDRPVAWPLLATGAAAPLIVILLVLLHVL